MRRAVRGPATGHPQRRAGAPEPASPAALTVQSMEHETDVGHRAGSGGMAARRRRYRRIASNLDLPSHVVLDGRAGQKARREMSGIRQQHDAITGHAPAQRLCGVIQANEIDRCAGSALQLRDEKTLFSQRQRGIDGKDRDINVAVGTSRSPSPRSKENRQMQRRTFPGAPAGSCSWRSVAAGVYGRRKSVRGRTASIAVRSGCQRVLPLEIRKAGEVAVGGLQRQAMLDGHRRQVRIGNRPGWSFRARGEVC